MKDVPWGTQYRLKAYVKESRDQFLFTTDLTLRGKEALRSMGIRFAQGALRRRREGLSRLWRGTSASPTGGSWSVGRVRFGHSDLTGFQLWDAACDEGERAVRQVMELG